MNVKCFTCFSRLLHRIFSFGWKDAAIGLKRFYSNSEIHFLLLYSVESFVSDNSLTFRILYLSRIQFLSLAFLLAQFTFIHLPVSNTPRQDALSIISPSSCRLSIILPSSWRQRVGVTADKKWLQNLKKENF